MSLEEYHKKRNFNETPEPEGKIVNSKSSLQFVIQRHSASRLHYDFRLEIDGVLKSWAIPKGPSLNPKDKRLAMMTEDHPFDYKDFEGTIPENLYGGGEIEIWDFGTFEPLKKRDNQSDNLTIKNELQKESLKFILKGKKLKGEFALVKIKNSKQGNAWLLIKHNDEFAIDNYDAENEVSDHSKVSERENSRHPEKIKKETKKAETKTGKKYSPGLSGERKLKDFIKPMLAQVEEKPFNDKDYIFEIKWDGYRAIADLRSDLPLLYSRNGISFAEKFSKIATALQAQKFPMILDGEIVAFDEKGKPNFQLLQQIDDFPNLALTYQVFDLLWLNGHSTENLSLLQRKELLKDALTDSDLIKYCDHLPEDGISFFNQIEKMGLEGMIAKKSKSTYNEGARSSDWLKIKLQQTEDVVICGYTAPQGSLVKFGALILGNFQNGKLEYCGHVGTGFTHQTLNQLFKKLQPFVVVNSPFDVIPKTNSPATWLRPELICEIKFTEKTKEGIFRHPVFIGLREDKNLSDLNPDYQTEFKEESKSNKKESNKKGIKSIDTKKNLTRVKLTNQNKIYFPESDLTKGELVNYYQSVAPYILPHLKNRPQSLNRFPNGIEGLNFYHKDAGDDAPEWMEKVSIFSESNEREIQYLICNTAEDLAYINNLGCIDLNPWNSTKNHLGEPDWLALDLDPSEGNTFEDVIETALATKEVLDLAKIEGYCKTSGRSGMHIFLPMAGKYTYEQVKNFALLLMQKVNKLLPEITTLERSLKKRSKDKIYLDYLQNRSGQTLASVYSVRPKPHAPVSMPLLWEEVKSSLKPTDFTIKNALERIKINGDLFQPVLGKGIDMLAALENLEKN